MQLRHFPAPRYGGSSSGATSCCGSGPSRLTPLTAGSGELRIDVAPLADDRYEQSLVDRGVEGTLGCLVADLEFLGERFSRGPFGVCRPWLGAGTRGRRVHALAAVSASVPGAPAGGVQPAAARIWSANMAAL